MLTTVALARQIAHSEGIKPVRNDALDYAIWERTGYPIFWETDDPMKEFEKQLRTEFRTWRKDKSEDGKG